MAKKKQKKHKLEASARLKSWVGAYV